MRKNYLLFLFLLVIPLGILTGFLAPLQNNYVVLGWNDLGMHCANKDFDSIVILPPYNNFRAQAILKGDAQTWPSVVTSGLQLNYSIPGNTYSAGKTNFWDYDSVLFGVNLPENTGLTGAGLSGAMANASDHFWVDGVPLTPYTDNNLQTEDPYQLALLELLDDNNQLVASTQAVMPVSNEINCVSSNCHSSEQDILYRHDREGGFDPNNTPILCSKCHADVALGMPGNNDAGSLSYVVHNMHKDQTNDCYKCHPGPNTQCFRGVMHDDGLSCQNCHGSVSQVAQSIQNGRRPWLDEPSCGAASCHGSKYAEEPGKLFRESKGHGGLYCSACHGSPHAIFPSGNANDNLQNVTLQGHAGVLDDCTVCHGTIPHGAGPHGYNPQVLSDDATLIDLTVDGTTINGFDPVTLDYIYYLDPGTTTIPVVDATPNNPAATADITQASTLPGTSTVVVTAENGVNTLTYTVDFEFTQASSYCEGFESGVPQDYFTGNLNLQSGTWYGMQVKRNSTAYAGSYSINLRKETTSYVQTPTYNGISSISFRYRGEENRNAKFSVQKKVGGSSWITLSTNNFNNRAWYNYTFDLNDPSSNIIIRVITDSRQKNTLLLDEFCIMGSQSSTPQNPGFSGVQDDLMALPEDAGDNIRVYSVVRDVYVKFAFPDNVDGLISIFDLSGRLVTSRKVSNSGTELINLSVNGGMYIVNVTANGTYYTKKIIIH